MFHSSLELSRDAGAKHARFGFWSDNQDTLRLSQRFHAQVVRTPVLLARALSSTDATAHASS